MQKQASKKAKSKKQKAKKKDEAKCKKRKAKSTKAKKQGKMSPSSSDGILNLIFVRFYLKNTSPNYEKIIKLY